MRVVLGIDPGETTGLCALEFSDGRLTNYWICQCNLDSATSVAKLFAEQRYASTLWCTEKFVVSNRAGRSSSSKAGANTRDLVGRLLAIAEMREEPFYTRSASEVKTWATNNRLKSAGIAPVGGHSADAARHALFAAVKAGLCKDPLSKEWKK